MRVTNEMMVGNSLHRLTTRLARYEHVQSQLATGKRILAPSDDPSGTSTAMSLRAAMRSREQEIRNAEGATSWLDLTDSQLQAGIGRLQRARDLAVRGASETTATERAAMAEEVAGVRQELLSIANYSHRGRPMFAGFGGGDAVVKVGADWTYAGDDGAITRRVGPEDVVTINVTAGEVFGFDPADPTASVFAQLDQLEAALRAGDGAGISAGIAAMDAAQSRMSEGLATVGAAANWIDSAQVRGQDAVLRLRSELSEIEDVDVAEAVMELQVQETAYQATLQALARALPASLVSFLG